MIQFSCDYLSGAHPDILKLLQESNMEQTPGYGKDSYCARAADLIRSICRRPDADVHFLVGGTQTNATVISHILRPYHTALCADTGHISTHETGAIEHSGHKVTALPSKDGKLQADTLRLALDGHFSNPSKEHTPRPGMVYISYPTELGTLYSKEELVSIKTVCREYSLPLYIDGARLGYGLAAADCDLTFADIADIADIFYIGGTKQGALFGEAVVIVNEGLKRDFRYSVKQNGGMLAKGRLLGIQFLALLKDNLYLKLASRADTFADRIREAFSAAGFEFFAQNRTNQVFPILDARTKASLEKDFDFEIWQQLPDGRTAVRFCTSWATTEEQVAALEKAVSDL